MSKVFSILLGMLLFQVNVASQSYPNIASYHFNGTQTHGVKIKTKIPFLHGVGMPVVKIEGYNYADGDNMPPNQRSKPLSLMIMWEAWGGAFNYPVVSSSGAAIPEVWLAEEGGMITIFLDKKIRYQRFMVSAFAQGVNENPDYFKGWTIVDEPKASSKSALCTYKNNFAGKIGIGTEDPQSTLDVRGKIIADEVQIQVNKGADFVFDPNYDLKSLSGVEEFVKENQHLPDIPSEKEMIEKGVNVNEMQIKLLQKIEELTLYLIKQKEEIKELKEEVKILKNK